MASRDRANHLERQHRQTGVALWSCRAAVAHRFAGHDSHRSHSTVRQGTVKTPNEDPEEIQPVTEQYEWFQSDHVAANGSTPVSSRHDREKSHPRGRNK